MKPPIQIVNGQDEVIAYKDRNDLNLDTDIYRVSALWITNSRGEILLAQRSFKKTNAPGKWGPAVAGTVEKDETYEINIYKEAEEEIGLSGMKFITEQKERVSGHRNYFVQWYSAVIDKPIDYFQIQEDEVDKLAWVERDAFIQNVRDNPDQYVITMPRSIQLFCSDN